MVDISDARRQAQKLLAETFPDAVGEYEIMDELTRTEPFGWVFSYESIGYLATGEFSRKLVGNAPIVVTGTGRTYLTGTAAPVEDYIAQMDAEGTLV